MRSCRGSYESGKSSNCWQQNFGEPMSRQILNGWKEISNHIERGVRTAQRWESLLGMPIHRPALKNRSAVVAFSDELDGGSPVVHPTRETSVWL